MTEEVKWNHASQDAAIFSMETDLNLLHDAELNCIKLNRNNKSLELDFRLVNVDEKVQASCKIEFHNIKAFRVENFLVQNVAMKIVLSSCSDYPDNEIKQLVEWVVDSAEGKRVQLIDEIETIVLDIRKGSKKLFYIDPSWGAEIGVIAQEVKASVKRDNGQST